MTIEVITYLAATEPFSPEDYSWSRLMESEEQVNEYINYLTSLEQNLPRKLRRALGPYSLVCSIEAQIIQIPDPQEFQRLLSGAKFHVRTKALKSSAASNTGGTIRSRPTSVDQGRFIPNSTKPPTEES